MFDSLYPTRCVTCAAEGDGVICTACLPALRMRPLEEAIAGLDGGATLAAYRGPVGRAVAHAKRAGERRTLAVLGQALGGYGHDLVAGDWFSAVVPVPSPWTRRLRRGFGPGHVVASGVATAARLPMWSVLSVAPGARQSALSASARRTNLAERLRCRPLPAGRVLLVDDVVTTGTSLSHCARVLRASGATSVWALGLCSATRHHEADAVGVPGGPTSDDVS